MKMGFFPTGAIVCACTPQLSSFLFTVRGTICGCNMQLKVFQHELACATTVIKVKASGLERNPWNLRSQGMVRADDYYFALAQHRLYVSILERCVIPSCYITIAFIFL
uniref:Uncharacterized protein n=1 Tax=Triticum urartu TaxID=4572 RepID=A0A8R7P6I8_TRIUA